MGQASDRKIEEEQKWQAAIEIAVRAGILERCDRCEEVTDPQSVEMEEAYKLANALFTQGDPLTQYFKTRQELTDRLQGLPKEFGDECLCDRQIREDG